MYFPSHTTGRAELSAAARRLRQRLVGLAWIAGGRPGKRAVAVGGRWASWRSAGKRVGGGTARGLAGGGPGKRVGGGGWPWLAGERRPVSPNMVVARGAAGAWLVEAGSAKPHDATCFRRGRWVRRNRVDDLEFPVLLCVARTTRFYKPGVHTNSACTIYTSGGRSPSVIHHAESRSAAETKPATEASHRRSNIAGT